MACCTRGSDKSRCPAGSFATSFTMRKPATCSVEGFTTVMIGLYCPGFNLRTKSRVPGSVVRSEDSGIIHRQRGEVVTAVQPVRNHLNFLARVGFVLRFVVLVVHLRVRRGSHED